jgi:hypothetical protein
VIRSSENLDRIIAFLPRVSSVALLLTLARHTEEGHLAYRSGVNTLAKGPLREDGPLTRDESIRGMRLRVLRRAAAIGVSAACRDSELVCLDTFYIGQLKVVGTFGR